MEKLADLDKLSSFGFKVCCFPIKIPKTSAAWIRPVAIIEEWFHKNFICSTRKIERKGEEEQNRPVQRALKTDEEHYDNGPE